ncbi:MAG: dihydrolipoyl dehydrogenase [Armatimonadetes bacterium]|nr:dihydrolipoyl dehydrogenase [Armatimonadota bacterium]
MSVSSPSGAARSNGSASGSFQYDVAVIGGGPGGYVAAIRAAQLGARVVVIEKQSLGGTCLNVGCIPTKAVISSVALYNEMKSAGERGLVAHNIGFEIDGIVSGAQQVVKKLVGGVGVLMKKNKITVINGLGSLSGPNTIEIAGAEGTQQLSAANIIIATGSKPARPPIEGLENFPTVWTSDNAVFADRVPEKLAVVGAGAVGLEFAYIFNSLGAKVTVVEMMPRILPSGDEEACAELEKALKKQGIEIRTNTLLAKARKVKNGGRLTLKSGDSEEQIDADVILLAAGRVPLTEGLNLEPIGVKMNRAAILVDEYKRTSVPSIWAIGDCIGEPLLAHAASAEGEAAASNIMGHSEQVNYHTIPAAVYTHPEYASVGYTEAQAREKYSDVRVGKFSFAINGRALCEHELEGFAKIIVSEKYGEILGAHIIGARASELIAECATAISSELTIHELVASVHAHPTLSEVVMEAAHDALGRCIHKA